MGEYLNLNEVGSMTQSAKGTSGNAQDTVGLAQGHQSNMEGVQTGFKGQAGSTFQNVSATNVGSAAYLGRNFADQAIRWANAEKHAVTGDEEAHQVQNVATSEGEASMQALSRPIEA